MGVYFLKRPSHAFAEVQHVSERYAKADGWVECVALDVFVDDGFVYLVFIGLSGFEFIRHLTRQCLRAHRSNVVVNELVHLDRVLVGVEFAQPAHTGYLVCMSLYIFHIKPVIALWCINERATGVGCHDVFVYAVRESGR